LGQFQTAPIGFVRNSVSRPRPDGWQHVTSRIELVEAVGPEAVLGLDGFSNVLVIFWLDRLGEDRPRPLTIQVGRDPTPRGILATRSQLRPTPLGCSVVRLLGVSGGSLTVQGLDAIDATPVLDVKPYIPEYDSFADATVPRWVYGGH
jgi:tRNA-Thr(GGU) m(6)t(6)A37 methyltransferase TsaA